VKGSAYLKGTLASLLLSLAVMAAVASSVKTFTILFDFDGSHGSRPNASLVQGADGGLYGTTEKGGANDFGTVFEIKTGGTLTTLHSFCTHKNCADGAYPVTALIQATDGSFYGTTQDGGANNGGTVFKMAETGALATLHSFCSQTNCNDGSDPSGLVLGADGSFYGTTFFGGTSGMGTVFEITSAGAFSTLYDFCSQGDSCPDGSSPGAPLVQAVDGNFYGTTEAGGTNNDGTLFKISPAGKLTTLHNFDLTDGTGSTSGLIQATDGNFYGTSEVGGTNAAGTVFKMTPGGTLTTLYNFCVQGYPCLDGAAPLGGLVEATDGNLYGTTVNGGVDNVGTVFTISATGKLIMRSFRADGGNYPYAALLQASNGSFYGTTFGGGTNNDGIVYALITGLNPFVETKPASGEEGVEVGILGQGFSTSSTVKFGGVQASKVSLHGTTALSAVVPVGALTGAVTVTNGFTTLTSNVPFRVTPHLLGFSPPSGSVGQSVTIRGVGLTQTLAVGFGDGVPATDLRVVSDTIVTAEVPDGARTGRIVIKTKGGIAYSSTIFTVTQ
jgi:uncharacterized repeat protein (TIGR03803 family)